jgi:prophage tail gpP-like protein
MQIAFIEVNGERLVVWDEYSFDSDMLVPADGFSFSVSLPGGRTRDTARQRDALRALLHPGAEVIVFVGKDRGDGQPQTRTMQLTGIIDDRSIDVTRDGGTIVKLEGRDLAGFLVDSSVPLSLEVSLEMPLLDLAKKAVEPWAISVVADSYAAQQTLQGSRTDHTRAARAAGVPPSRYSLSAQQEADRTGRPIAEVVGASGASQDQAQARATRSYANSLSPSDVARLTAKEARPQAGETVWAFLDRHARRLGCLMWMGPDGKLILGSPRYEQSPSYKLVRRYEELGSEHNNILAGGVTESIGDRFSEVTVLGRGNAHSRDRSNTTKGSAKDEAWPTIYPKPLIIHENGIKTKDEAARRALRELSQGKSQSFVLRYTTGDHAVADVVWAVDSTAQVLDEPIGVDGVFYTVGRTFAKDRKNGTSTSVRLYPRGSIVF